MIEFIDRRFVPELEKLAREVEDARWHRSDRAYAFARRAFNQVKAQWTDARERLIAPELMRLTECPRTLAPIVFVQRPDVEPREVNVQPREPAPPEPAPYLGRCLRCGASTNGWALLELCPKCFGMEGP